MLNYSQFEWITSFFLPDLTSNSEKLRKKIELLWSVLLFEPFAQAPQCSHSEYKRCCLYHLRSHAKISFVFYLSSDRPVHFHLTINLIFFFYWLFLLSKTKTHHNDANVASCVKQWLGRPLIQLYITCLSAVHEFKWNSLIKYLHKLSILWIQCHRM